MKALYKEISIISEETGYSVDFLFRMLDENDGDLEYIAGVSYEHDW